MLETVRLLLGFPVALWRLLITYLPGDLGNWMRERYWRKRLRYLGQGVTIDVGAHLERPEFIEIGDNCWIDRNVTILAGPDPSTREKQFRNNSEYVWEPGVVHIGNNVHIGIHSILSGIAAGIYVAEACTLSAGVRIYAFTHHYRSQRQPANTDIQFGSMAPHERQCLIEGPVVLGRNTGVALNAIILPGVSIAENCFVAINSVVHSGRFTANSMISGSPAKATGPRFLTNE